jgi:sugar transferase (PEP-CTERM/EpsH1 system associated)
VEKVEFDATRRDLDEVLFLCHRIPYPPDKGDKIRSKRWLDALTSNYRVHLGAFVDDPEDWQYEGYLRDRCEEVQLLRLLPFWAKVRGSPALLTGGSLTSACYRNRKMRSWVHNLLQRRPITRIVVYSSAMAQYVVNLAAAMEVRKVIDFVDVDSDKWRQYARRKPWPISAVYRTEARRLLASDLDAAQRCDASIFVSTPEARLFMRDSGTSASIYAVANGVDATYFEPSAEHASPFRDSERPVVFTGAMDYWANVDAVRWFVSDVWPSVRRHAEDARLYVVGARPGKEVQSLASDDIVVTGRVPDVRPYLQYARGVVAPMRIARGIQNKVLEGMAMAKTVLTTTMGAEGLDVVRGQHLLVEDEPAALAARTLEVLQGDHQAIADAAYDLVRRRYSWGVAKSDFLSIVDGGQMPKQVVL